MQLLIKGQVIDQHRVEKHLTGNEKYLRRVMALLVNRNHYAIIRTGQHPEFCLAVRSRFSNPTSIEATNLTYARS